MGQRVVLPGSCTEPSNTGVTKIPSVRVGYSVRNCTVTTKDCSSASAVDALGCPAMVTPKIQLLTMFGVGAATG